MNLRALTHQLLLLGCVVCVLSAAFISADVPVIQAQQETSAASHESMQSTFADAIPEVGVAELGDRLIALDPADAMAYFKLAEEVAYEEPSAAGRRLATQLYVLAWAIDEENSTRHPNNDTGASADHIDVLPSVCLGLRELVPDTNVARRDWLRTLARAEGGPAYDPPRIAAQVAGVLDEATRLRLAEMFVRFRRAEYRRVQAILDALENTNRDGPNAREALILAGLPVQAADDVVLLLESTIEREGTQARERVEVRPGPGGVEAVLDPEHRGNPGPRLSSTETLLIVSAERALLGGTPARWSVLLAAPARTSGSAVGPLLDLDPQRLPDMFAVDVRARRFVPGDQGWQNGRWVRP